MALTRLRTGGIAANAVVAASIAPGAVDITDIADGAVTEAKLATNAVTETKLATNAVVAAKIANNAVVSTKLSAGSVEQYFSDTGYNTQFRNRIINGDMRIDQRNAGALINPAVSEYTIDRWSYFQTQTSKGTIGQNAGSVTLLAGFTNYLGFTSTSAYSILNEDQFLISQSIEGFNVADLGWGSANAQSVTLSFWAQSSLTGTFGSAIQNSNSTRNYPFTFAINSANTWEYKTVTIPGDTTGTWLTTNGKGLRVTFSLGTGSTYSATAGAWTGTSFITSATGAVSVVGTSGATFYITGVQLEVGEVATPFERRPFGTELALCQRYYYKTIPGVVSSPFGTGWVGTTSAAFGLVFFPVTMRSAPSALEQSGTAAHYAVATGATQTNCTSVPGFGGNGNIYVQRVQFNTGATLTVGQGVELRTNNTAAFLAWSAEL